MQGRSRPVPRRCSSGPACAPSHSPWLLTHTSYSLRYAYLYYQDADSPQGAAGGLEFPRGAAPCESDFADFSFTVGMTFQVSDVIVTSHAAQAVLAFTYTTAVLAFCLQLIFGAL